MSTGPSPPSTPTHSRGSTRLALRFKSISVSTNRLASAALDKTVSSSKSVLDTFSSPKIIAEQDDNSVNPTEPTPERPRSRSSSIRSSISTAQIVDGRTASSSSRRHGLQERFSFRRNKENLQHQISPPPETQVTESTAPESPSTSERPRSSSIRSSFSTTAQNIIGKTVSSSRNVLPERYSLRSRNEENLQRQISPPETQVTEPSTPERPRSSSIRTSFSTAQIIIGKTVSSSRNALSGRYSFRRNEESLEHQISPPETPVTESTPERPPRSSSIRSSLSTAQSVIGKKVSSSRNALQERYSFRRTHEPLERQISPPETQTQDSSRPKRPSLAAQELFARTVSSGKSVLETITTWMDDSGTSVSEEILQLNSDAVELEGILRPVEGVCSELQRAIPKPEVITEERDLRAEKIRTHAERIESEVVRNKTKQIAICNLPGTEKHEFLKELLANELFTKEFGAFLRFAEEDAHAGFLPELLPAPGTGMSSCLVEAEFILEGKKLLYQEAEAEEKREEASIMFEALGIRPFCEKSIGEFDYEDWNSSKQRVKFDNLKNQNKLVALREHLQLLQNAHLLIGKVSISLDSSVLSSGIGLVLLSFSALASRDFALQRALNRCNLQEIVFIGTALDTPEFLPPSAAEESLEDDAPLAFYGALQSPSIHMAVDDIYKGRAVAEQAPRIVLMQKMPNDFENSNKKSQQQVLKNTLQIHTQIQTHLREHPELFQGFSLSKIYLAPIVTIPIVTTPDTNSDTTPPDTNSDTTPPDTNSDTTSPDANSDSSRRSMVVSHSDSNIGSFPTLELWMKRFGISGRTKLLEEIARGNLISLFYSASMWKDKPLNRGILLEVSEDPSKVVESRVEEERRDELEGERNDELQEHSEVEGNGEVEEGNEVKEASVIEEDTEVEEDSEAEEGSEVEEDVELEDNEAEEYSESDEYSEVEEGSEVSEVEEDSEVEEEDIETAPSASSSGPEKLLSYDEDLKQWSSCKKELGNWISRQVIGDLEVHIKELQRQFNEELIYKTLREIERVPKAIWRKIPSNTFEAACKLGGEFQGSRMLVDCNNDLAGALRGSMGDAWIQLANWKPPKLKSLYKHGRLLIRNYLSADQMSDILVKRADGAVNLFCSGTGFRGRINDIRDDMYNDHETWFQVEMSDAYHRAYNSYHAEPGKTNIDKRVELLGSSLRLKKETTKAHLQKLMKEAVVRLDKILKGAKLQLERDVWLFLDSLDCEFDDIRAQQEKAAAAAVARAKSDNMRAQQEKEAAVARAKVQKKAAAAAARAKIQEKAAAVARARIQRKLAKSAPILLPAEMPKVRTTRGDANEEKPDEDNRKGKKPMRTPLRNTNKIERRPLETPQEETGEVEELPDKNVEEPEEVFVVKEDQAEAHATLETKKRILDQLYKCLTVLESHQYVVKLLGSHRR